MTSTENPSTLLERFNFFGSFRVHMKIKTNSENLFKEYGDQNGPLEMKTVDRNLLFTSIIHCSLTERIGVSKREDCVRLSKSWHK